MTDRRLTEYASEESGAIAPLYALALFGLIGMAGIGWDYSRLMALDSELQNAADQAALAAATQLDGTPGARDRARQAITDYLADATTDFVNKTRMANDGEGQAITDYADPVFYQSYDSASDAFGPEATSDANAKVVSVKVNGRKAFYALTPVVGAINNSGDLTASAVAGMNSTICKVPPLMICNPNEASGGDFPTPSDEGKGLRLEPGPGTGAWGPGNYGFLNFGESGASALEKYLGANSDIAPCADVDAISTQPGAPVSVAAGLNTRLDIYDNGLVSYCERGNGQCSPAMNTRKDLIHMVPSNGANAGNFPSPVQANDCKVQTTNGGPAKADGEFVEEAKITGNTAGWLLPPFPYRPSTSTAANLPSMGFPRDLCHAETLAGTCPGGKFGNKIWDYTLYFDVNFGANGPAYLSQAVTAAGRNSAADLTRYDVYKWEIASGNTGPGPTFTIAGSGAGNSKTFRSFSAPKCAAGKAESASEGIKDRRVLTAAVVNCTAIGLAGNTPLQQAPQWVDVFLTEPSLNRRINGAQITKANQIYVEVVGPGSPPGGGDAYQYFGRNKPVLLR
ncbi:pilus assembly protein TadG-related protein [Tsuneonella sp. SYSU-LHT278]|uniref:pilus assembly protein TadG-related protein n=1 Tax=Tsuneonella sediminis TaxID=3416089 RepID=UPI003F79C16C